VDFISQQWAKHLFVISGVNDSAFFEAAPAFQILQGVIGYFNGFGSAGEDQAVLSWAKETQLEFFFNCEKETILMMQPKIPKSRSMSKILLGQNFLEFAAPFDVEFAFKDIYDQIVLPQFPEVAEKLETYNLVPEGSIRLAKEAELLK
jgi:hypothetical protein